MTVCQFLNQAMQCLIWLMFQALQYLLLLQVLCQEPLKMRPLMRPFELQQLLMPVHGTDLPFQDGQRI